MKFNCGLSRAEKYQRNYVRRIERRHYLQTWHPYFCWFPKQIASGDCRWLEYIERRGTYYEGRLEPWWIWEFRAKKEK